MAPTRRARKLRRLALHVGLAGIAATFLLIAAPVRSAQDPAAPKAAESAPPTAAAHNPVVVPPPNPKEEPTQSSHERAKADAAQLSALADQLRDELNKMNINVFSLDVVHKTNEIEKLARRIKDEAHGR